MSRILLLASLLVGCWCSVAVALLASCSRSFYGRLPRTKCDAEFNAKQVGRRISVTSFDSSLRLSSSEIFSASPSGTLGLMKDTKSVIFGDGTSKFVTSIGMPRVMPPGKPTEDWFMWFHVRDSAIESDVLDVSTGRIMFATSKDGLSGWKLHEDNPLMGPNKENGDWFYFDSEHVGLGDVIQPGDTAQSKFATQKGVFLMYIFGGRNDGPSSPYHPLKGTRMEIGLAVSQDGAHWSRVEGPSAFGAILEAGKPGEIDEEFVGWPNVLERGSEYWMYYHTLNRAKQVFTICRAVAKDGLMRWTKQGIVFEGSKAGETAFDARGASRRHVTRLDDGWFRMWYEAIDGNGVHSIGTAASKDGISWSVLAGGKPVFQRAGIDSPAAWDAGGVGSPHMVWLPDRRRWRMYYVGWGLEGKATGSSGIRDGAFGGLGGLGERGDGIGVAESVDEAGTIFERVDLPGGLRK